ncbi:pentapeptide repeat-containing protein [Bradyrhizobium sp.]
MTSAAPEGEDRTSPEDQEQRKRRLEIKKLELENAKLTRDATPLGRLYSAVVPTSVSVITAVIAIGGILLSISTLREQTRARTEDASDKALQQALSMATDPTGGSDRRISGVYQLRRFWSEKQAVPVVAATLTSILALPDDVKNAPLVRCAAAEVIGAAFQQQNGFNRDVDLGGLLFGKAQKGTLGILAQQNRLFARGFKPTKWTGIPDKDDLAPENPQGEENISCLTPLGATREAIRKAWDNLRDTNLQWTDLRSAQLYEADLHGVNLEGANLRHADLRCANLSGATLSLVKFDNATLTFANFQGAQGVSGEFIKKSGGIQISDEQWKEWKMANFDGRKLMAIAGKDIQLPDVESISAFCSQSLR